MKTSIVYTWVNNSTIIIQFFFYSDTTTNQYPMTSQKICLKFHVIKFNKFFQCHYYNNITYYDIHKNNRYIHFLWKQGHVPTSTIIVYHVKFSFFFFCIIYNYVTAGLGQLLQINMYVSCVFIIYNNNKKFSYINNFLVNFAYKNV